MGDIVHLSRQGFDLSSLRDETVKVKPGLISPATEKVETELAVDHAAEPIKSLSDIMRISDYLVENERYRDNMLFIVGINFGLRVGDLRSLRFSDIMTETHFKDSFPVFEQKTRNTRKRKKNRYITINTAVREAVILYLEHTPDVSLSHYMFRSESNRGSKNNVPLCRQSIDDLLKGIAKDLDLDVKMSTHTLRKTFAYHQMVMSNNDPRKLVLLCKILGHSSVAVTLDYIGITGEEISEAYKNLNLGSREVNYLDSGIVEDEQLLA